MLINAGVVRIVFGVEYGGTTHSRMFLEQAGVEVCSGKPDDDLLEV
jgi:hypothetical protein